MLLGGFEIPTWLVLSAVATGLGYWYFTRRHDIYKKAGIPGPTPLPFLGTLHKLYGQCIMETDQGFKDKYGKFVGTFEGSMPTMLVFDVDFLREAYIKNFQHFQNRRIFGIGGPADYSVLNLEDEHWKYVRSSLSPTFTQGKLKSMLPHIQQCADVFVQVLAKENSQPCALRKKVCSLTSDVIATTAFGIQTDSQTNPDSEFNKYVHGLFNAFEGTKSSWERFLLILRIMILMYCPPWVVNILYENFGICSLDVNGLKYMENLVSQALEARMESPESEAHDFVQTMAHTLREAPAGDVDTLTDKSGLRWSRKGLTKNEIVGNAIVFIIAGFQTTADSMLFIFYELAMNPEIQQRLYEEIEENCTTEKINIDQINKMKYLECCINEALRLYPQGIRFDRVATSNITINGIPVEKDTCVTTDAWIIHRDPELWPDPDTFDPDRFLPENSVGRHPCAFIPFGIGNRSCIGNRLAMLEMKVAVIQCLRSFRIDQCDDTPTKPLKFKRSALVLTEKEIVLKFVPRSD